MVHKKKIAFGGMVRNTGYGFSKERESTEAVNVKIKEGSLTVVPPPTLLRKFPTEYRAVYHHTLSGCYLAVTVDSLRAVHRLNADFSQNLIHTLQSERAGTIYYLRSNGINYAFTMPAFAAGDTLLFDNGTNKLYHNNAELNTTTENIPQSASELDFSPQPLNLSATGVNRIEFMGNMVCLFTDLTTLYMLYDTGEYRWLGEKPEMPDLAISCASKIHEITTEEQYYGGYTRNNADAYLHWENVAKGYFDQCISRLNGEGYFIDQVLFRFAFRLFDGNYIWHSPIYYVRRPEEEYSFASYPTNGTYSQTVRDNFTVKVTGFKPTFRFSEFNLEMWKNIIVSVDLFATKSLLRRKVVNEGNLPIRDSGSLSGNDATVGHSSGDLYERYIHKTDEEIWRDVADSSQFYRIAEYDLSGNRCDEQKNVSADDLALCEALPDDSGTHHTHTASYSYVYNNRLHLADVATRLFGGYAGDYLFPGGSSRPASDRIRNANVYVYINTEAGTSVVRRNFDGNSFPSLMLSPYLMYPDNRAYKMLFEVTWDGVNYSRKTFSLTKHKYLNLSYFLNADIQSRYNVETSFSSACITDLSCAIQTFAAAVDYTTASYRFTYDATTTAWQLNGTEILLSDYGITLRIRSGIAFAQSDAITVELTRLSETEYNGIEDIDMSTWGSESIAASEQNVSERRHNLLKVSASENPLYYPPKSTYTPSRGDIVALCSNTAALSQGQFGQHPLYLFCSDGIWAMSVDSTGKTAYYSSIPVSRDVCDNPNSICGLDTGVVFSSSKGIMLIHGSQVEELSAVLEGSPQSITGMECYLSYNGVRFRRTPLHDVTSEEYCFYAWQSLSGLLRYTLDLQPAKGDTVYSDPAIYAGAGSVSQYVLQPTDALGRMTEMAGMGDMLSSELFIHYCRDCRVGYAYRMGELWIANPSYPYTFVLDLNTGHWSKRSVGVSAFVHTYPSLYLLTRRKGKTSLLNPDNTEYSVNRFLCIMRPFFTASSAPARLLQAALHGVVRAALGTVCITRYESECPLSVRDEPLKLFGGVGVYLSGSNDGKNFQLVCGGEFFDLKRDLAGVAKRTPAYRYWTLALAGEAHTATRIDCIEMILQEKWNNKIR